ncbi:MAG: hypothetical protein GW867_11330 [Armatimonadetes bacterium]|nr:hypothetical protein [Armatimonadota bacterium]
MCTPVGLFTFLALAACAEAAPLRIAVLNDDLPGLDPALVGDVGQVVERGGHVVTPLTAEQLADSDTLSRQRQEVLVLSHSPSFPGRARANVEAFLQAGGNLVLLGGFAYSRPVARVRGAWQDRAGFEAALRDLPNVTTLFSFDTPDSATWRRGTNHPEHPSKIVAGTGPVGACLRLELKQLGQWQWDTYSTDFPRAVPAEHDLFCFRARGSERTPQVAVEIGERDGSRWVAAVELSSTWQRHVLEIGRFRFLNDGSPATRGGTDDHLNLSQAARLSFGLASGLTKHPDGDHVIEIDEIGTAVNDLGVSLSDYQAPNSVCFDDYEPYELREAVRVSACSGQDLAPADAAFEGPVDGLSAVGFTLWDRSRFVPLLVARDRYGRGRGWACSALVHYGGKYAGGCWLLSGITTPAFYRSGGFRQCLTGFLSSVAAGDLPKESLSLNQQRLAKSLPLTTPPPAGLKRQGQHFVTAAGKPLFLIGADNIGSLDRKFFGGPWVHWLEADFRRARDAGLNSMRIYGASALWRDPQKLAALKECARKYGVYLLIVVVDHTDLLTREELVKRSTQVATAFRDEPVLLGYDLQNEPYAYKVAEVKDGGQTLGERSPLWKRWGDYERWAGLQMLGNFTSFPGVGGPLPRDVEWGPVLDATSGLFADWIGWQVEAIRAVDPGHPITVGFNTVFDCLPGTASLDFVSHHAYQPPTDYDNVLRNLTTLDRLRQVWPDRPITLGEFGYTNGLALPDGYLDLHTSALGEFLHYLYAYAHGFDGCMKWALTDHPLELSRQQCNWMPADDLPAHLDQGRYGMFWSDGTEEARPKPLVWALRFFRDYLDAGGQRGELTVEKAPTRIGTGYVFRAPGARFVGNLRHAEPGFSLEARQAANVLVRWNGKQAQLLATADATVRLDPVRLFGWRAGAEMKVTGKVGASRWAGNELVVGLLEGETVRLAAL